MVLTVTLNPLLERRLYFNKIDIKSSNRAESEEYSAGGKGINISRQLNNLGIKNMALTFLGGSSGKKLRSILEKEAINFSAVSIKDDTREASLIIEKQKQNLTTYFGVNSNIQKSEIDNFKSKLEKSILNASIVVFSGSIPNDACAEVFSYGMDLCSKYDKLSVLDTYGIHLKELLSKGPDIVHNNFKEVEDSLKFNLNDEKSRLDYLDLLYKNKVKLSFLTNGSKSIYASKYDFHYKIENPVIKEIDATGSGDSFLSGIIYGLEKALVFEDFVKLASALGALNAASWETCNVELNDALILSEKVSVKTIGKKMKLLDDSPTI